MQTISELKEQAVTETPLVLFDCTLANGTLEHWSTHAVTVNGTAYAARVIRHSGFNIQTASDQGVDGSPTITVLLANADSHFSELQVAVGWRGATLTVNFVFYDLVNNAPVTDAAVVFQGICNPPDQIQESTFRLSATNRMSLQRAWLPEVRIQTRCPWTFPSTPAQQLDAVDGGADGQYSMFYRCGYSAGQPGGTGNLNNGAPFTSCGYVMTDCQARGMQTRFGGLDYVPPAIEVRPYGKNTETSALSVNQARYNDYVPMVYGTAWYYPLVTFARNDGNLTRMEVLLGIGQMQGVVTVLVNGIQIPLGVSGANMTGTGWYNVMTLGTRDGGFDPNFTSANGQPAGDPYGSMAYLSVVVPNSISDGNSLPTIEVLVQGLLIPVYAPDGTFVSNAFSANPAWILLDVLRRSGWAADEIDLVSFATVAAYCDEQINTADLNGNAITIPRFQCNLVLQHRRSAGDVIRGIRNGARLYLTYGPAGVLQLAVENTVALQQPTQSPTSNSTTQLNGGWPAYEFGDGSTGISGILRRQTGAPSVAVTSRSIADTPNCYTVEFQDALNGYQQDSYTVMDTDDVALTGQQTTANLLALGLPNYDQAARMLQFTLDKTLKGNTYIQFDTSVKAFGIRPGDIITVTYQKEGFNRQPFRVSTISPATNYRTATILAQIQDDAWYLDTNGQSSAAPGTTNSPDASIGLPRPLMGAVLDAYGDVEFGVAETDTVASDGSTQVNLKLTFDAPTANLASGPGTPLVSFAATLGSGGTLKSGEILYYAVSGVDGSGNEGGLSFVVTAVVLQDNSSVTLSSLSFTAGTASFNVYRGATPANLFRIATTEPLATSFTDTGLSPQLVPPPDPSFGHANFYWRMELQPETAATIYTNYTVGNGTLEMPVNQYRGLTARITRGTGAGQEQSIAANDATSITTTAPWCITPDASSYFVVAESGWHFGAVTQSSPVSFQVPNLGGETIHLTGRAANVLNQEQDTTLAIVTRWQIGGSEGGDSAVPSIPSFALNATSGGAVVLSGIGFTSLEDTASVSSATLTLHYWNELSPTPGTTLASTMAATDAVLNLTAAGSAAQGSVLQIDGEVLAVTGVTNNGTQYGVTRGLDGSPAAAHNAQTVVYQLSSMTVVVPFPDGFFGSPYCGNWSYPILLPDARIAGAELWVTNGIGNSPTANAYFTNTVDEGLRTLSGGQYSIQVAGFLAVDQFAAPALVVDASHSVRDVFAILGTAADAAVNLQLNLNGASWCQLNFSAGAIVSGTVDGFGLPALTAGAQITLSVLSVGQTYPGADLTVLIRL
ncbi:MAG: phage tail protein [Bryobacteraceae bacterium]